ncbi:MAG: thioredoxin family protein [Flavobacteriaceae bacterium]
MLKKLIIILFIASLSVNAQDTIRIKINPIGKFKKVMIYSVVGANQKYVANASLIDGGFKIVIPSESAPGIYRLYFDVNNGYFDFIYNHESVSFTFEANAPETSAVFDISEENKVYQAYLNSIQTQQYKVDSIQYAYFNPDQKPILIGQYATELNNLYELQESFEKAAEGKMAFDFITSNEKYYHPEIVTSPQKYLEITKTHFFDYIDFSNQHLMQSSFFVDKAIEYVFYMNSAEDKEMDTQLKKDAIEKTMLKVEDNFKPKSEILNSLIYAFASQQNVEMTLFILDEYYSKLPEEFKSETFVSQIKSMIKLAIGVVAPEITWQEGDIEMKLSDMSLAQNYVLVFWSTSCSHCLIEIPSLYDFTSKFSNVKVIAVALEENDGDYLDITKSMTNWIHVLGLGKWENKYVKMYDIISTPTYFVLDADKKIILKPQNLEEIETFFKGY